MIRRPAPAPAQVDTVPHGLAVAGCAGRRLAWLPTLALLAVLACSRPAAQAAPLVFAEVAPGLQHAAITPTLDGSGAPAGGHVLRFSPRSYALRVVTSAQSGAPVADAQAFRAAAGAVAAFNGGFFDAANAPLGLLVSEGRQISPLRKVDHGVFAVVDGKASVRHASQWQAGLKAEFAVECGPRLLVDGEVPHFRSPEAARRTALGVDDQGQVVVVVTTGGVSLDALAQWIRLPRARGGLGAVQALNLDGGKSTMLAVQTPAAQWTVASPIAVPVGIAVVARR